MSLLTYNFESQYLNNNHTITVILPDKKRDISPEEFYRSGKKYKVLWLLHGTFGAVSYTHLFVSILLIERKKIIKAMAYISCCAICLVVSVML